MLEQELRFSGSVPDKYDQLMVPLIFRPYAEELAGRARALAPKLILETAAGTGALTEALSHVMAGARIVATDLNPPMLEVASKRIRFEAVQFLPADAQNLPFENGTFDLVVCQFGSMFFPDKVRGHAEARRVLRKGGHYLLAIWDRIERNQITYAAQNALIECFPEDPPLFMREGPFGYHDTLKIETDLHEAGFETVDMETIELRSKISSARDAALALFYGTPMGVEVEERQAGSGQFVLEAVERALRSLEGPGGIDAPMAAHIVTAFK